MYVAKGNNRGKGAVHDFMGDFDVLHLVFCLAYMHKSAFID